MLMLLLVYIYLLPLCPSSLKLDIFFVFENRVINMKHSFLKNIVLSKVKYLWLSNKLTYIYIFIFYWNKIMLIQYKEN